MAGVEGGCQLLSVTSLPYVLVISSCRICSLTLPIIHLFIQQQGLNFHCLSGMFQTIGIQQGARQISFPGQTSQPRVLAIPQDSWNFFSSFFLLFAVENFLLVRLHSLPFEFFFQTRSVHFLFKTSEVWEFGTQSQSDLKTISAFWPVTSFPELAL